ncbi:hypothetical protein BKA70DRAFT_1272313 [Coprinopsis sp. MPI-PUGE-AT-0042]|nr:hypothetical protein BKA70DRAFT_1272313 [Coprinopsis sp. MPI-PUGE-AT-0042]
MLNLLPYRGLRRRLVIAFDLGTTFSGVSYAILDPGQVPEIKGVTRFPAHEQVSGASKIPTIIYYDEDGNAQAFGAEALQETVLERAAEEEWTKAEWFKLHVRPNASSSSHDNVTARIPPLPEGKAAVDLIADFFAYLFKCTEAYIVSTHANGRDLWNSVCEDIDFVLSHPNGWEGYQQTQMRRAAVVAGLVPGTRAGHGRINFITEGEASLHFAIRNGLPESVMESGQGVIIVDAGGGTIDISSYRKPKFRKTFEEICAPQCHFYGSIFVSINARLHLEDLLSSSEFESDIDHIVRCFDRTTKIRFRDDSQAQYVKFGSTRDNDADCGIRFGQLKLSGEDVASFFEPSIRSIVSTVKEVVQGSQDPISHVVLVGGFGSSEWLYKQLQLAFEEDPLEVMRPELYVNKAVSDGAVAYYVSHMVTARIARYSYGTFRNVEFKPDFKSHKQREGKLLVRASGRRMVPNKWEVMLAKGTKVSEETEIKISMWKEAEKKEELKEVFFDVICYKGRMQDVGWKDEDEPGFKKLCRVEVDLSNLILDLQSKEVDGKTRYFYVAKYWVVLLFNSAELKAQMVWMDGGVEKRSTASLVFYQD